MMLLLGCVLVSASISLVRSQTFLEAIGAYPTLSNFTAFYRSNKQLASLLLTNSTSSPHTVLVPSDEAFQNYELTHGSPVTSLSPSELEDLVHYHVLVGGLTSDNFTSPLGLTAPTLLTGEQFNNRTPSAALQSEFGGGADGQVVFISSQKTASKRRALRQLSPVEATVQTGLGSEATLTAIDGVWDGGRFHEVNRFFTLPQDCQYTMQDAGLGSLSSAIGRVPGQWDDLNHSPNYTCLAPNDAAFNIAGDPQSNLNASSLGEIIEFHTIPQPLYTNFVEDGQLVETDNHKTIRVTIRGRDIYFNDAKVVQSNIITNNGVIHVLDRVMSDLDSQANATTTASSTSIPTSSTATGAASASATTSSSARISTPMFSSFAGFCLAWCLWMAASV